jgi:hypothetical protein
MQQNNEGEKANGGWVLCNFLGVLFCGGSLFSIFFVNPIKFFITKNLVITYKLSTIEGFCHKKNFFATILVFLSFCHNFTKKKNEKKMKIKECVASVII